MTSLPSASLVFSLLLVTVASLSSPDLDSLHLRTSSARNSVASAPGANVFQWRVPISDRPQWESNGGYCGEVSMIQNGLLRGQYMSQYDMRNTASPGIPQYDEDSWMLVGACGDEPGTNCKAEATAQAIGIDTESYCYDQDTFKMQNYLRWLKQQVQAGNPILIGVFINQWMDWNETDPNAGDQFYDHLLTVSGVDSVYNDDLYHDTDYIYLEDHFNISSSILKIQFSKFPQTRAGANSKKSGQFYSVRNDVSFAIALKGVLDSDDTSLPVRVDTNPTFEYPEIEDDTTERPKPASVKFSVMVSGLTAGSQFILCRYASLENVPTGDFANCSESADQFDVFTAEGDSFLVEHTGMSDEIRVYRAALIDSRAAAELGLRPTNASFGPLPAVRTHYSSNVPAGLRRNYVRRRSAEQMERIRQLAQSSQ